MKPTVHIVLLALMLSLVPQVSAALADQPQRLHLLGRSTVEGFEVKLDEKDWQWLRDKRALRLGVTGRITRRSK
ncbi:hypothetical protein ABIA58_005255 [Pseudomonas frederiksbergensis]